MNILIAIVFLLLAVLGIYFFGDDKRDNWYWLTIMAVANAALISLWLVWKSEKLNNFTTKAMGFGAWFWFLIFIQVMLYGFYVGITK